MKPCKRIEIVVERNLSTRLEQLLQSLGVSAYTVIPDVGGLGDRGHRRADEVTGTSANTIFIIVLEDSQLIGTIAEAVKPVLVRSGGLFLLSDAQFLSH